MFVLLPVQTEELLPVFADGNEFTVILTEFDLVHPVDVIVSVKVYVVVVVGFILGFEFVEVNPVGFEAHE